MDDNLNRNRIRVLVVGENFENTSLIKYYFEALNCTVDYAENGRKAIENIKSNQYDICIISYFTSDLLGDELVPIIRKEVGKDLHIIGLFHSLVEKEKTKFWSSGIDDFLPNSFGMPELKEKIIEWTKNKLAGEKGVS